MKPLAETIAKASKPRKWYWCTRDNGFSTLPKWRMVADRLRLPAYQVIAFVHWLEEFANEAGNIGRGRGEVSHFNAAEAGFALGMSADDAARIYAALEDQAVGWIAFGHIATFDDRNWAREEEREASRLRKRKQRSREAVLDQLAKLGRLGRVDTEPRLRIETALKNMSKEQLDALLVELNRAEIFPQVTDVTCDAVTVTLQRSEGFQAPAVDNNEAATRREAERLSEEENEGGDPQEAALVWLSAAGLKIVTQRTDELTTTAANWIERWLHQRLKGDAVALRTIIEAVRTTDASIARFLSLIDDGIKRHLASSPQRQLPMGPAPMSHVTSVTVDNLAAKRSA